MAIRWTIFSKILVILLVLFIPMLILYTASNQQSMSIMENQIREENQNRLSFFLEQVDTAAEQFSKIAFITGNDPDTVKFQHKSIANGWFDVIEVSKALQQKIKMQSNAAGWTNMITVFATVTGDYISTNPAGHYSLDYFQRNLSLSWTYRDIMTERGIEPYFILHSVEPGLFHTKLELSNLIIEIGFSAKSISLLLDQIKLGTLGDPFFYHQRHGIIGGSTTDRKLAGEIAAAIEWDEAGLKSGTSSLIELNDERYLVFYTRSEALDWYLINAVPLNQIFDPIHEIRNSFYRTMGILLLIGIVAAFLLYRNVQLPIRHLITGISKLRKGQYSTRITKRTNNEFSYLFMHFNKMSEQMQELIERVLFEQLRVREAEIKKLQSQINPHFLHNCFAFVQMMARLDRKDAVIEMTKHLSQYYRYAGRVGHERAPLREELDFIAHYLDIHAMQLHRLTYRIELEDELREEYVPILIVQPIVENAVMHGVEQMTGEGIIAVKAWKSELGLVITVDDNGPGMNETELREWNEGNRRTATADGNVHGLWNAHQRLQAQYGVQSGITLERSPLGGLRAIIIIPTEGADSI